MEYVDPIQYSKQLSILKENQQMPEMAIPPDGHKKMSLKEKIASLTPEKQEELKQYVDTIKEVKRKITEIIKEAGKVEEVGGPIPVDSMHLNTEVDNKAEIEIVYTDSGKFYKMHVTGDGSYGYPQANQYIKNVLGDSTELPSSSNDERALDNLVKQLKQKGHSASWIEKHLS